MKHKIYTLYMALFLVCGEVFAIGGMCDNIKWNLDKKGVLTITGVGEMRSYKHYPWEKHKGSISCLIINEGITSIGNRSFEYCTSLTSVTIPNGIKSIGKKLCFFYYRLYLHESDFNKFGRCYRIP